MEYLREKDAGEKTVIAVQIENEPGILGSDRDYSGAGERELQSMVPQEIVRALQSAGDGPVWDSWQAAGARPSGTWTEMFGWDGGEFMTAWSIARYIDSIAEAGKQVYDVPMYVNVWLGEGGFRLPGIYPSGGAVAKTLDIWLWVAPHLDLIAPDIYIMDSEGYRRTCAAYVRGGNPLFVPESGRSGPNAWNMFYALGRYDAIGYHAFGIDSIFEPDGVTLREQSRPVVESFRCAAAAIPLLLEHQGTGRVHAVVQEENQAEQYLDLGNYIGVARFASAEQGMYGRDYHHGRATADTAGRGRGLVIQAGEDEFYVVGADFRLLLKKKTPPHMNMDARFTNEFLQVRVNNYVLVDEGLFDDKGNWVTVRRRSGDESDYGIWVEADVGLVRVVMGD
jgi:hypothetical protein